MDVRQKEEKLKKKVDKLSFKALFQRIVTSHTSPHQIAFGAALGMFLSVIPTFYVGMLVALFIAWKRNLNLLATYLGTLVVNPFTGSFVYYLNYQVGSWILGVDSPQLPITFHNIKQAAAQTYLGGFILAVAASFLLYLIIYSIIHIHRKNKEEKR